MYIYIYIIFFLIFHCFYVIILLSTPQVAVLLHVGGSGEHLYILCHLLCCPAEVGKWASSFLQVILNTEEVSSVVLNN